MQKIAKIMAAHRIEPEVKQEPVDFAVQVIGVDEQVAVGSGEVVEGIEDVSAIHESEGSAC